MDMEDMVFDSLDDLNCVQMEEVNAENRKPFEGLTYSRYISLQQKKKRPSYIFRLAVLNIFNERLLKSHKIFPSPSSRFIIACPGNICDRNLKSGLVQKKSMSITNMVPPSGRVSGVFGEQFPHFRHNASL